MSAERRSVTAEDGTSVSYLDTGGDGSVVVFLHGLGSHGHEFRPAADALPEARSLLVDQRGHGASTRRPDDVSRAAFVSDVVNVIEAEATEPVVLVGHSMGGHTAFLVAAARPDLVDRLLIMECTAAGWSPAKNAAIASSMAAWPVPFPDAQAVQDFFGGSARAGIWAELFERGEGGLWPQFDADVIARVFTTMEDARWGEWRSVVAPTLAIYGDRGSFTEAEQADFREATVGRVTSVVLSGDHDLHTDPESDWIGYLRKFLV